MTYSLSYFGNIRLLRLFYDEYVKMVSILDLVVIPSTYLAVVFALREWMKNRVAYECKLVMRVYNLIQVGLSLYVFLGLLPILTRGKDWWNFSGVNTLNPDLHSYYQVFFYTKYFDFFDTLWIVLRKKDTQFSALHLSHHASVVMLNGSAFIFGFVDNFLIQALLNAFVHAVMYFHYFWTSLGYKNPYSKWITTIQMIQFFTCILCSFLLGSLGTTPLAFEIAVGSICYALYMIVMFGNFSKKKYVKKVENRE